eukprot:SAG22_NODE_2969_length_2061_cov_1.966871_1_plen_82_part_10
MQLQPESAGASPLRQPRRRGGQRAGHTAAARRGPCTLSGPMAGRAGAMIRLLRLSLLAPVLALGGAPPAAAAAAATAHASGG